MSIETLLTVGVAVGILALAVLLRLLVGGGIRLVRLITGHPRRLAERSPGEQVAPRRAPSERGRRILDGFVALLTFVVASAASWWRRSWSSRVRSSAEG